MIWSPRGDRFFNFQNGCRRRNLRLTFPYLSLNVPVWRRTGYFQDALDPFIGKDTKSAA